MLWLQKVEHTTQQLYRWALELSCLNFTVKHVAGTAMHDADVLSRAPLDRPVEYNEEDEWESYAMTGSVAAPPEQTKYNVMTWGYGIGCDIMATDGTSFTIVGGCETDDTLATYFTNRTAGAPNYGSVEQLGKALDDGLQLPPIDVLASTLPCSSRCRWNRVNKLPKEHDSGSLFVQQLEVIRRIKPRVFYAEMAPPDPAHNNNDPGDYTALERGL